MVKALNYTGTPGTLTAIVGGTGVTKSIRTCTLPNISISGPSSMCSGAAMNIHVSSTNPPLLSAYPNPASSILYIELGDELQTMLQSQQSSSLLSSANVYRLQLVAVQTGAIACNRLLGSADSQLEFNVSNIPDGLYSLNLTQGNAVLHTETILIQH
ncbi:MAG: T9SS type A sorting domain-containing protein [Prevotellaceae bacterium]|nr:T9SS type A sorting domain-containing protein [Prevotellaceae bacterium]